MQFIVYILIYPLLWLISLLPFRLLYLLSDGIYILIYYIIGYRKKTVRANIALALPHLSDMERLTIEKKSYHHLCDMFLEMIKTMSISYKQMEKRYVFTNLEEYKNLEKEGKSIIVMLAHYASYEWLIAMNNYISHKGFGIYKKIANPYFDKLVKRIRSKYKTTLINTKETIPTIETNNKNKLMGVYGFVSDQSPKVNSAYHWNKFMGIEVPVHTGAEMLAKRFDMNVVFLKVKKIKRGYYEATFDILTHDNIKEIPNYELTDTYLQKVELQIYEAPEYYFWTHKRWKHRR